MCYPSADVHWNNFLQALNRFSFGIEAVLSRHASNSVCGTEKSNANITVKSYYYEHNGIEMRLNVVISHSTEERRFKKRTVRISGKDVGMVKIIREMHQVADMEREMHSMRDIMRRERMLYKITYPESFI